MIVMRQYSRERLLMFFKYHLVAHLSDTLILKVYNGL